MTELRLNQGVGGLFYLPHFAARELGTFRDEGLAVEFVTSFYGREWQALTSGGTDLSIGGTFRSMWLQAREGKRVVHFCAAVRANPWYLVGRQPEPGFAWTDLIGRTVIDFTDAGTPKYCLRWLLQQQGIPEDQVTIVSGLGTARELEAFRAGEGDYLMHSLHTAALLVAEGAGVLVKELATPTGPVPWSCYAALPETLVSRRNELEAFTRAITRTLRWIAASPSGEVAALVLKHYPGFTLPVLADAIGHYQATGIWSRGPLVPRADFEHFRSILLATGWIPRPVPYEDQVDTSFAEAAIGALGQGES